MTIVQKDKALEQAFKLAVLDGWNRLPEPLFALDEQGWPWAISSSDPELLLALARGAKIYRIYNVERKTASAVFHGTVRLNHWEGGYNIWLDYEGGGKVLLEKPNTREEWAPVNYC